MKNAIMSDLVILAALVLVVGLITAFLFWLNTRLGGWSPSRIEDNAHAISSLEQDHIGVRFDDESVVVATDHLSAFAFSDDHVRLGLVVAMGDRLVTRLVGPEEIGAITSHGDNQRLMLKDWTLPVIDLSLTPDQINVLKQFVEGHNKA